MKLIPPTDPNTTPVNPDFTFVVPDFHYASLNKFAESRPVRLLATDELDQIDETAEKIQNTHNQLQLDMVHRVEESYDRAKQVLMSLLDKFYEPINDLIANHSKYHKFESLIRDFQDRKSDFELDENDQNHFGVVKSLRNLFLVEHQKFFQRLICVETLSEHLTELEAGVSDFTADLGRFESIELFNKRIKTHCVDDQLLTQARHFARISLVGSDEAKSVWDDHSGMAQLRQKVLETPPSVSEKTSGHQESLGKRVQRFLNHQRDHEDYAEAHCFAWNQGLLLCRHSQVYSRLSQAEGEIVLENYQEVLTRYAEKTKKSKRKSDYKKSQKKKLLAQKRALSAKTYTRFDLFDLSRGPDPRKLLEFRLHLFKEQVLVSSSDRYVAFLMSRGKNWLICEFTSNFGLIRSVTFESLGSKTILDMLFVDSPGGEKMVFVDELRRLNVFDLTRKRIEFELTDVAVSSVEYIDRSNVLLLTNTADIGIFSLATVALTSLIRFDSLEPSKSPMLESNSHIE